WVGDGPGCVVAAAGAVEHQHQVAGAGVEQWPAAVGAVVIGQPASDHAAPVSRAGTGTTRRVGAYSAVMARMSSSLTKAARTRTGSGVGFDPQVADPGAGRRVGGYLVAER